MKGPVWKGDNWLESLNDGANLVMVLNHKKLDELVTYEDKETPDSQLKGMTIVRKQGDYAIVHENDEKDWLGIYSLKENQMIVTPQYCSKVKISHDETAEFSMVYGGRTFYDLKSGYCKELDSRQKLPLLIVKKGAFSLLRFNDQRYMTRTRESYATVATLKEKDIVNHGFYLTLHDHLAKKDMLVCLVANDDERYYWLAGTLPDGSIYVMDSEEIFYHVSPDSSKELVDRQVVRDAFLQDAAQSAFNYSSIGKHATPVKIGSKWGLKLDDKLVVAPKYRKIVPLTGHYFIFEDLPMQWGLFSASGKILAPPRYSKITMRDDGTAILEGINGKVTELVCM